MSVKEIIRSQYGAALEMLRRAIVSCPDDLWHTPEYRNQSWNIAYHAVFFTHFYLHSSEEDFVPWEKHRRELVSFDTGPDGPEGEPPYTKEDILAYHRLCLEQVPDHVDALDLNADSGFHWLPFDKLELQFYNIRHLQQHTGELCERLGVVADIDVDWIGMTDRA